MNWASMCFTCGKLIPRGDDFLAIKPSTCPHCGHYDKGPLLEEQERQQAKETE